MNEQGAGIGLLLCYDFIESLGWSVEVNSTIGKGTIFHIFIKKSSTAIVKEENNIHTESEIQLS